MNRRRVWPRPWAFALLILPVAVYFGFTSTPLPFLLRKAGVSVYEIGTIGSILQLPNILVFLWAPMVDVRLRRRTWLVFSAISTSVCLLIALLLVDASSVREMTALLLLGGVSVSLVLASSGGLMVTTLPVADQSKAAAWNQAGYLAGGALGGALALWLVTRLSLVLSGLIAALVLCLPGLVALTLPEKEPTVSHWFKGRISALKGEIGGVWKTPVRRWTALLLMAPAATGAAQGLLPAIASHYGVGASGVIWINGLGGAIALAAGSLLGTMVPPDWDGRIVYAGAGLSNGIAGIVLMSVSGQTGYLVGTIVYLVTQGLCWARFTGLIVEIVGPDTQDASTLYSALAAAGSIPLAYMTWLDGFGYLKFGTHGLLMTDAAGNLIVFVIVLVIFLANGLRFRHAPGAIAADANR